MYPSSRPRSHKLLLWHWTGSLSPPLVQPVVESLVMQVDAVALSITPTPPVLADNPVVKPTTPLFHSGLASSIHAPGNTMDKSDNFSPKDSAKEEHTSTAQKKFKEKIELRLTGFETQLARIAGMLATLMKGKANVIPPAKAAPSLKQILREIVEEVHKLCKPIAHSTPKEASLPSADASVPDMGYASALGRRAKITTKKLKEKEILNANIPGSKSYTNTSNMAAQPNTPDATRGYINISPPPHPMFSMITAKTVSQGGTDRPFIKAAKKVQKSPLVMLRPGATSSMEITIIRRGGVNSKEEQAIRNTEPKDIVDTVRKALNKATAKPPVVLGGRWSSQVQQTGNFVFTIHGVMDAHQVQGISLYLCDPFPGECYAVPLDGWMWVHLWGVPTVSFDRLVYNHEELANEVFSNPCFQGLFVPGRPSWLQHPAFVQTQEKATVMMAYVDRDNLVTNRAKKESIVMFGKQVQFVLVGDKPIQYQCSRCWGIGHRNKECCLAAGVVRCFICGGSHHGNVHNYKCVGKHMVLGVCTCKFKCLMCGGVDHHAASPKCLKKAGVQIMKEQWRAIMKQKEEARKDAEFESCTHIAPQGDRMHHKGKKHIEREWTPVQKEIMEIAAKVQVSPCVNNSTKTKAGCACCKPPTLDYVEVVVRNYPYPTLEKMEELMTNLPEATDRISELVIDRDLASAGSQPTAEMSSSAEPFPPKSLGRHT